jgi:hypothetical protein
MNGSIRLFNIEDGVCCRITIPKEHPKEALGEEMK